MSNKIKYAKGCIDCVGSTYPHRCQNCGRKVTYKDVVEYDKKIKILQVNSAKGE